TLQVLVYHTRTGPRTARLAPRFPMRPSPASAYAPPALTGTGADDGTRPITAREKQAEAPFWTASDQRNLHRHDHQSSEIRRHFGRNSDPHSRGREADRPLPGGGRIGRGGGLGDGADHRRAPAPRPPGQPDPFPARAGHAPDRRGANLHGSPRDGPELPGLPRDLLHRI